MPSTLGGVQTRGSRVARGWIAGTFATAVAAGGHGIASGSAPDAFAVLNGLVFAGLLGTFAIGRRPSLPRLIVVVVGAQLAFHLVFSFLTPGTAVGVGHKGMAMATLVAPGAEAMPGLSMWAGHAVAALATIVFLRRAELALWTMLREALDAVTLGRRPTIAARPRIPRDVRVVARRRPTPAPFLTALSRRGPPVLLGA